MTTRQQPKTVLVTGANGYSECSCTSVILFKPVLRGILRGKQHEYNLHILRTQSERGTLTTISSIVGHAIALAFVRAGYKTYGLIRNPSFLPILASEEIIPLLGTPSSLDFLT